jgi:hypothetical protein
MGITGEGRRTAIVRDGGQALMGGRMSAIEASPAATVAKLDGRF